MTGQRCAKRISHDQQEVLARTSFRDFAQAVFRQPPERHDGHWRPQHLFCGQFSFDVVGRFENLAALLSTLNVHLGEETNIGRRNANFRRCDLQSATAEAVDVPALELRPCDDLPAYPAFYDEELVRLVADYYRPDIETFGYDFTEASPVRSAA